MPGVAKCEHCILRGNSFPFFYTPRPLAVRLLPFYGAKGGRPQNIRFEGRYLGASARQGLHISGGWEGLRKDARARVLDLYVQISIVYGGVSVVEEGATYRHEEL